MRQLLRLPTSLLFGAIFASAPAVLATADDSETKNPPKVPSAKSGTKSASTSQVIGDPDTPEFNLLNAMQKGLVSVKAEGRGDGRITVSVTNRTNRPLRVILPPGIVAAGASGQMGGMGGGMGGMGGGMGGMGGGGMGGGGMGGRGGGGGMGGMGGMGRSSGTMPPMMGMMMLSNIIMYFCGDVASWDRRSLMMGMGGGGMMGGMGGGMGGMGGGMGGMGGGMRSVPPSDLPYADLKPRQTRELPTSIVSLTNPDLDSGLILPEKGERLRIVGDIAQVSDDPLVQKALRRLAGGVAPASVSQLVMWRLAGRTRLGDHRASSRETGRTVTRWRWLRISWDD